MFLWKRNKKVKDIDRLYRLSVLIFWIVLFFLIVLHRELKEWCIYSVSLLGMSFNSFYMPSPPSPLELGS